MANTYTQLYVHAVFAVYNRECLIDETHRDAVEKYMCGIVANNKSKMLAIYCNPDHTHILIGLHPSISVSDMLGDVKGSSSKWINEKGWVRGKFYWQEGYGAFSYSKSQIDSVAKYILNQSSHHKKVTFKDEYLKFMQKFGVEYDPKYIFEWI